MFLVVAALEEELHSLRIYLSQKESFIKLEIIGILKNSLEIYKSENIHIGLLRSGVGKVLSSTSISLTCALYDVSHVLCVGSVLGIESLGTKKNIEFGDVICIKSAIEHDVDYGPFLEQSLLTCDRGNLYTSMCAAVRENSADSVYVDALILTGDVYIDARKKLPQKIVQVKDVFLQKHSCVVLDMETAALCKSVQHYFNVEFAALGIVLDSLGQKQTVNFRKQIKIISDKIADITKTVIGNIACFF